MNYVIIGGSAAGAQAAEDLRKLDPEGSITLVSEENTVPYSRCLLSRFLDGRLREDQMYFKTGHFFDDYHINGIIGVRAVKIDRTARKVLLSNGDQLDYDKVLLATGARPALPKIPGIETGNVFAFHGLHDAKAIRDAAPNAKTALVIGAGFAGLEAAYALARLEKQVIVVERCAQILPNQLDPSGALIIQKDLEEIGVDVVLNASVRSLSGAPSFGHAMLGDGSTVFCDLVVAATGTRPNKELAEEAGLETEKGILVNEYLQTADPDVYAAGDSIEVQDVSTGRRVCSATWFNAVLQGKYAAFNMAGFPRRYSEAVGIQNAVQFHRVPAISFGLTQAIAEENDDIEVMSYQAEGVYKKLILKGDRVCGLIFVGDIARSGFYAALIRHRVDISEFRERLLDPDFTYAMMLRKTGFGQRSPYLDTAKSWDQPDFWTRRAQEVGIIRTPASTEASVQETAGAQ